MTRKRRRKERATGVAAMAGKPDPRVRVVSVIPPGWATYKVRVRLVAPARARPMQKP
jgi:hypothetical protein